MSRMAELHADHQSARLLGADSDLEERILLLNRSLATCQELVIALNRSCATFQAETHLQTQIANSWRDTADHWRRLALRLGVPPAEEEELSVGIIDAGEAF